MRMKPVLLVSVFLVGCLVLGCVDTSYGNKGQPIVTLVKKYNSGQALVRVDWTGSDWRNETQMLDAGMKWASEHGYKVVAVVGLQRDMANTVFFVLDKAQEE